jgi:hypothetical protein
MTSAINSIPSTTKRQIGQLKAGQETVTSRIASDTTGMLGNGDPDHFAFLTPAFKSMQLFQTGNSEGVVGTLALMPKEQHASVEDPYYYPNTPFVLDRAGKNNFGFNIARPGTPPAGYYGGDKVLVQKRFKIYSAGENYPDTYSYGPPVVREEPKGYVLQENERYDGGFYPGSTHNGVEPPYGNTFPTDSEGHYVYTGDPFTEAGWDGTVYSVPDNDATKPTIDTITPNYFTLPDTRPDRHKKVITITGSNLQFVGFVMIGPYRPDFFWGLDEGTLRGLGGAFQYREINFEGDYFVQINLPSNMLPGVYTPYVIGVDGQVGKKDNGFTVYAEGGPPNSEG